MSKILRLALLIALCLILTACSVSTLVTTLDMVATAAAVANTIVSGTGSHPKADAYLSAVATAASSSATELQSSDSSAIQYTKVAGYFAEVGTVSLDANTSAEVKAAIAEVEFAIQVFLAELAKTRTKALSLSGSTGANIHISANDRRVLRGIPEKLKAIR